MLLKKLPENLGDPGKFLIPCNFPGMDVCHALADLGASINLMPLSIGKKLSLPKLTPTRMTLELADRSITRPKGLAEDVFVKVGKFHFPTDFVVVDFEADPRVPLILERSFLRTGRALIDVYGEEITLRVNDEAVLGFSTNSKSSNPTPSSNPILSSTTPLFTPFEGGDFILEEIETFLQTPDEFTDLDDDFYDTEGDILYLEQLLNEDPSPTLPPIKNEDLKQVDVTKAKSSIEEPLKLELKDLPAHLEYAFLEGTDKLPMIITKGLKDDEKEALLKVLKSHKWAIAWKITDIKGIDPHFCTHKILMEDDCKPTVQSQRRVNLKIHKVIKKEVIKLLAAEMIYPISDSPWVSPIHCVPKKGGMTVVANEENELIPTRLVTGWRVCIDYRKLNEATRKDHFPLPFMDQMLKRLAGNEFYCFLDGFSGYFQIPIDPSKAPRDKTFHMPYELSRIGMPFVVEGIVLGHKISKSGIEVDRAKVDVIAKLPHPTTVKGVRSFLDIRSKQLNNDLRGLNRLLNGIRASWHRDIRTLQGTDFDFMVQLTNILESIDPSKQIAIIEHYLYILGHLESIDPSICISWKLSSSALEMLVPGHAVGNVMGRGRANVDNIRKISEASVEISDNKSSCGDRYDQDYFPGKRKRGKDYKEGMGIKRKDVQLLRKFGIQFKGGFENAKVGGDPNDDYAGNFSSIVGVVTRLSEVFQHLLEVKYTCNKCTSLLGSFLQKVVIYRGKNGYVYFTHISDRVLLFNSRLKIFSGKLKTRWSGPFTITQVFPYGTIELSQPDGPNFKVNGHRVKHYFGGDIPSKVVPDLQTIPMDN
ncbi:reverse transcriptase domain-containing protein [Tanacetum coccineum]|uniref:Reverse transcriptase domain-containing protein n=1 Tax=Tanacetum coccineum TaxID=301880 RepID=A0ABQ5DLT9_9ASTR